MPNQFTNGDGTLPEITGVDIKALFALAEVSHPREVCGFLLEDTSVIAVTNVSEKDEGFIMDEAELLNVYKNHKPEMMGMFHSHPSGDIKPSFDDAMYAPARLRYFIITPEFVTEWNMQDEPPTQVAQSSLPVTGPPGSSPE